MRPGLGLLTDALTSVAWQKKNTQSGTEFKRTQEAQAAIMREKQAKGVFHNSCHGIGSSADKYSLAAAAKEGSGEAAGGKKK